MKSYLILPTLLGLVLLVGCVYNQRPQTPEERLYLIKSASFPSKDPYVQLAGELTIPNGEGSYPAVILLTGSGPQNRDEEVLGHKPFLVISDYLTRMGFAVLRYDDRGVGESTGNYETADLYNFADDASGAFSWLKNQPQIDKENIGYLGHSEGGYIAPLASLTNPARFMIFLAGSAKPLLPDVMISQSQAVARANGESTKTINDYRRQTKELTRILEKAKNPEEAKLDILQWGKTEGAKNSEIKATIRLFANRWGMTYARYDPLPALRDFKNPVLALFGGSDLEISARENAPVMKKALSHPQSRVYTFPNKNHLFQNSDTGKSDEFYKITTTIEPVVLEKISDWLKMVTVDERGSH